MALTEPPKVNSTSPHPSHAAAATPTTTTTATGGGRGAGLGIFLNPLTGRYVRNDSDTAHLFRRFGIESTTASGRPQVRDAAALQAALLCPHSRTKLEALRLKLMEKFLAGGVVVGHGGGGIDAVKAMSPEAVGAAVQKALDIAVEALRLSAVDSAKLSYVVMDHSSDGLEDMDLTIDQKQAVDIALQGYHLLIGGSAGTGKTVLLKLIHSKLTTKSVVTGLAATTGVAAVHLGGQTFHSLVGVPAASRTNVSFMRDSSTVLGGGATPPSLTASGRTTSKWGPKKYESALRVGRQGQQEERWDWNVLRGIDCLIVDEVSMLSADVLDELDVQCRAARLNDAPFGGLQVILCGDFMQLSVGDPMLSAPTGSKGNAYACGATTASLFSSPLLRHFVSLQLVSPLRHKEGEPLLKLLRSLRVGGFDKSLILPLISPDRPSSNPVGTTGTSTDPLAASTSPDQDDADALYLFPRRRSVLERNARCLAKLPGASLTIRPQCGALFANGTFTPGVVATFPAATVTAEALWQRLCQAVAAAGLSGLEARAVIVMPCAPAALGGGAPRFLLRARLGNVIAGGVPHAASTTADGPSVGSLSGGAAQNDWLALATPVVSQLGGTVAHVVHDDAVELVPVHVVASVAELADPSTIEPFSFKLGCRVMITRNLSKDVVNGSTGTVVSLSPPDRSLMPVNKLALLRGDANGGLKLPDAKVMSAFPVVELDGVNLPSSTPPPSGVSGIVTTKRLVQIPPVAHVAGGTYRSYFYGQHTFALPLQLGYAFTVHKVQGLTLPNKVVLDCREYFTCPHLIYVAISRVKSLDQLRLVGLERRMIKARVDCLEFCESLPPGDQCVPIPAGALKAEWAMRDGGDLSPLGDRVPSPDVVAAGGAVEVPCTTSPA